MKYIKVVIFLFVLCLQMSCGMTREPKMSIGHIQENKIPESSIPELIPQINLLPAPGKRNKLETYTVIVSNVPVKELLFSLARDANLNLDLHDDIKGNVSINAIDQTFPQILNRLRDQVNIRYEINDNYLKVREDKPYFRTYAIDYVNMERQSYGTVRVATTLGSTGSSTIGNNGSSGGSGGNGSSSSTGGSSGGSGSGSSTGRSLQDNSSLTSIVSESKNEFWETLENNIIKLIDEEAAVDSGAENAAGSKNVVVNKEGGVMVIRATYKQHKNIQEFVDKVINNAKRQVLIEATIAEIKLSDSYQSGVDWSVLSNDPNTGINFNTDFKGVNLGQSPFTALSINEVVGRSALSVTLRALEQFGDVKVLSSPKIMAINNQPAILKVVDNFVYFEMSVDSTINTNIAVTTFDTEIRAVPVGFVMSVTPYINEEHEVTLNIRPTISRIIDTVDDPNPEFKRANVVSEVPVIQVREIESLLKVNSGDTAIIGGLMQDTVKKNNTGIPFLSSLPLIGGLFSYREELHEKSELIIFIRPVVVGQASLKNDLKKFNKYLPENL